MASSDVVEHSYTGDVQQVTSTPTGTDVPDGFEAPTHLAAATYVIGAPARDITRDELTGMDPAVVAEIEGSPLYGNGPKKAKAGSKASQGGDGASGTAAGATAAPDGGTVGVNRP